MSFVQSFPIRFGHCDPAGIVFYPRYFEMISSVVEAWFEGPLATPFTAMHLQGRRSVPTARFEVEFTAPSRQGEVLDFSLTVEALGRTSVTLAVAAACAGQRRIAVRQVMVFVDMDSMRPTPWTDELRGRIESFRSGQ